jgi:hypothetical protein
MEYYGFCFKDNLFDSFQFYVRMDVNPDKKDIETKELLALPD